MAAPGTYTIHISPELNDALIARYIDDPCRACNVYNEIKDAEYTMQKIWLAYKNPNPMFTCVAYINRPTSRPTVDPRHSIHKEKPSSEVKYQCHSEDIPKVLKAVAAGKLECSVVFIDYYYQVLRVEDIRNSFLAFAVRGD